MGIVSWRSLSDHRTRVACTQPLVPFSRVNGPKKMPDETQENLFVMRLIRPLGIQAGAKMIPFFSFFERIK